MSPSFPFAVVMEIHTRSVYTALTTRGARTMHRRVNITLPEETIRLIDRVAAKGDRSHFIAEAVRHYVGARGRAKLRRRLREGAVRRAERDLQVVADWSSLDEEAWQRSKR